MQPTRRVASRGRDSSGSAIFRALLQRPELTKRATRAEEQDLCRESVCPPAPRPPGGRDIALDAPKHTSTVLRVTDSTTFGFPSSAQHRRRRWAATQELALMRSEDTRAAALQRRRLQLLRWRRKRESEPALAPERLAQVSADYGWVKAGSSARRFGPRDVDTST